MGFVRKPPPPSLFLTVNIKIDRILTKIFYIVFQILKILLIKICNIQSLYLLFLVVLLASTSADIIFHKFLELHPTLSEKKIFITNFPFLID